MSCASVFIRCSVPPGRWRSVNHNAALRIGVGRPWEIYEVPLDCRLRALAWGHTGGVWGCVVLIV